MRGLFEWLFWEDGYLIWRSKRYILLRLFVKMIVYVVSVLVCSMARMRAYIMISRLFEYLDSLLALDICSGSLKTSEFVMLPFPFLFGRKGR